MTDSTDRAHNMVSEVGFVPAPPFPSMNFTGNLAENFKTWVQRFRIYLEANGLDEVGEKRKISILLNCIGEKGIEIYNTFNTSSAEKLDTVIEKFKEYFNPKRSLTIL
ncbi:unnamed protein product [Arctia plantaginis]|nr:unnamed protein product [Arctia plantaginis]